MVDERLSFKEGSMFEYNELFKKRNGITLILLIVFFALIVTYYVAFLRTLDTPITNGINSIASHILVQIKNASLLGTFYSAFFGGLFFIIISMEGLFMTFFRAGHNPLLLVLIYVSGIFLSYNLNYMIGKRLANVSKSIITPKKFYRIKGYINRFGPWAIFVFNVVPLPSQILSAILGVFKYNRTRFNLLTMGGQITKYLAIILGYIFIF